MLDTPELGATKWWSTGLPSATHAVVFAQMYTPDGTCHGLHMFFLQLRGPDLKVLPGLGRALSRCTTRLLYTRFTKRIGTASFC